MNPPAFFSGGADGGGTPSPRRELQGPRPSALKVNKDSHKIKKPPVAPPPHHPPSSFQPPPPQPAAEDRQPVIIYAVSPKVIHTTVSDFMNLVQRLTGNATDGGGASSSASAAGDLSPAARLASIEKTSPAAKDRESVTADEGQSDFLGDFFQESEVETGRFFPGILSPAPGSLPPVSPGFFSPAVDPFAAGYNMYIPSPSALFSAPMASPSPSSSSLYDLFNNSFFDF